MSTGLPPAGRFGKVAPHILLPPDPEIPHGVPGTNVHPTQVLGVLQRLNQAQSLPTWNLEPSGRNQPTHIKAHHVLEGGK